MTIQTYLGFDVGTKRTGIAIANSLTCQAKGIKTIKNNKNGTINWQDITNIVKQYPADCFIIGLPLDKENKEQEMTFVARSFGRKIADKFATKVVFCDEYLSSMEAKKQLKWSYLNKNADRGDVDMLSAQLILQDWLNES